MNSITGRMPRIATVIRTWITAGVLAASFGAVAQTAQGTPAPYPQRPVRVVVGFAPGGPTDLAARLVARHLSSDLGQPFVVDNKPGAGGNIGTTEAARGAPDGTTLLVTGVNLTVNPAITDDIKVDSRRDLRPVRIVAVAPSLLVVRNDFPAASLKDFISVVRQNPGKFSAAAPGATPLTTVLYNQLTGSRSVVVPYKGAAPAMVDLIAGHVDLSFGTLGSVLPQVKAGKIRALAVAARERDPMLPDVPTFAESGLPDFRLDAWSGVLVPAGTPDEVIETLARSLDKLVASPDFERQLADAGLRPVKDSSPASFTRLIDEELALYRKLADAMRSTTGNRP